MLKISKIALFIAILLFSARLFAQNDSVYFPTGMRCKEVIAEPEYLPLDTINSTIYEIGIDTIINGHTFKHIIRKRKKDNMWIREDTGRIWLISNEYTREILLYDFNVTTEDMLHTEYIRETDNGVELFKIEFSVGDYRTTTIGNQTYQYLWDREGTTIRGIGRVTDLNRNCSLLGYRIPKEIIPGIIYCKVLWIRRGDKEIFRSESATEWITEIPGKSGDGVDKTTLIESTEGSRAYDLQGRPVSGKPGRGLYIRGGRVWVAK